MKKFALFLVVALGLSLSSAHAEAVVAEKMSSNKALTKFSRGVTNVLTNVLTKNSRPNISGGRQNLIFSRPLLALPIWTPMSCQGCQSALETLRIALMRYERFFRARK